jgi:hypothetical protein
MIDTKTTPITRMVRQEIFFTASVLRSLELQPRDLLGMAMGVLGAKDAVSKKIK